MTHKRREIREAIVDLLDTGSIVASGKVFETRLDPLSLAGGDLPFINVTASEETAELENVSGDLDLRELQVEIEIVDQVDASTTQGSLDDLAEEVEQALDADSSLGGKAITSDYRGFSYRAENEGETTLGRLTLKYRIQYRF